MENTKKSARTEKRISHHGRRIRHARLMKGYTLRQLADVVECSESMISKLENSRLSPSLAMLHRLADALDTTVPDLLILDRQLPGLEGLDRVSRLRHHPDYCFALVPEYPSLYGTEAPSANVMVRV